MAQEKIALVAERFWRTILLAKPRLPTGVQTALDLRAGTADISWALALVLAAWRLLKQQDPRTRTILQETGALAFITRLDSVEKLIPAAFTQFLQTAEGAGGDANLAGAAVYLQSAFDEMIDLQRNAFVKWATGTEVREHGATLASRFPQPNLGLTPTFNAPSPRPPSRQQRFDQADRPAPRTTLSGPTIRNAANFPVQTPQLSQPEITRAHLYTRGWDIVAVDRVMSGPKGNTGPLFRVRQILKTYATLTKTERMIFQKIVDESEEAFTREALKNTSVADLNDLRTVESLGFKTGLELFRTYKELPIPDRQRVLAYILTTETRFTPAEMNAVSIAHLSAKDLE